MNKPAPSKLFKLKKWLTLQETARHLSCVCGEEVTQADIFRLALDGYLKLSVNFVNHTYALCGTVVGLNDVEWVEVPVGLVRLMKNIPENEEYKPILYPKGICIGEETYLNLDTKVTSISDVWDLPMIGGERLDIEHHYQQLTGGPEITLQTLDGAFVENHKGVMCQLQERYDQNPYQRGSTAELEELKKSIAKNKISLEESEEMLSEYKENRKKYLAQRENRPHEEDYYPAASLPIDSVLVVRTEALRAFEQHLSEIENESTASNDYVKSNGHKERHAQNREQVLGAAFAILAKWPDECTDSKRDPVASKIANLVEAKADLFWPDSKPPLTADSIADHLRGWIQKANTRK